MIVVAIALGALGIGCMLIKRSLLGLLVGVQLLTYGAGTAFVMAGAAAGMPVKGQLFGLFITLSGVAQLVVVKKNPDNPFPAVVLRLDRWSISCGRALEK